MAKVWKVTGNVWNSLPLAEPIKSEPAELFSLFEKRNGRHIRISTKAYPIKAATIVFTAQMAENITNRSIRKIKIESDRAQ